MNNTNPTKIIKTGRTQGVSMRTTPVLLIWLHTRYYKSCNLYKASVMDV